MKDEVFEELILRIQEKLKTKNRVRLFSINRKEIKSLDVQMSMKSIVTNSKDIRRFNEYQVKYIGKYSSQDELAFFDMTPDVTYINGRKITIGYIYNEDKVVVDSIVYIDELVSK